MTSSTQPTGTNLDPWRSQYSARTKGLAASEVRALFAVASRPEVVSLAGGMPAVSALPRELVREAADSAIELDGPEALQYGGGQGIPELREQILDIMAAEGIEASVDDVVTTTGSQQAIDLITRLFIDPGDVILAEGPSYVGALGVFRAYEADVRHVPMDADGLVPDLLRDEIARLEAEGRRIKFLYTVPNFHNPGGVTMPLSRRREVLEICREHSILVVEDNPYGLLHFDEPVPPAMRSLDAENVVYLGSFSKTFSPGFRVGWALAPHGVRDKLVLENESAILSPSNFSQKVISHYLDKTDWRAQVDRFRDVYRERRDAMIQALEREMPEGVTWNVPNGGFYVWLQLPPELDSKAMLPRAVTELVAYTPGTAFYFDGRGRDNIRLSFCFPTPERIQLGIKRLATVIDAELDLIHELGGAGASSSSSAAAPARGEHDDHVVAPPPNVA